MMERGNRNIGVWIDTAKKLRDKYIKENGLDKKEDISNSNGNII
ncbi:hypothetical protein [Clostridium sp.]|jgi:hypothetical protein|nr:hypothetical protein [Clostridium sp.]